MRFVSGEEVEMRMPPKGELLSAQERRVLEAWIAAGAVWPESASVQVAASTQWWSLQPLRKPEPPLGGVGPVDAFVRSRLARRMNTVVAALSFQAPINSKVAAAGAAAAFAVAMPAFAGDAAAGESVFSGNCAACHAGGQNVIMPEKTLQQEALEEYLAGGANVKAVVMQVTNGKNAMPAFGGRLSDEDIENVATYVINTAKAGWD